jgi:hypothetical protein
VAYKAVYQDDSDIPDDAELWRRINPDQFVQDDNLGRVRPSSVAFSDSSDGTPMSVDLATIVVAKGGDASTTLVDHPGCFLVALTAGQVRDPVNGKLGVQLAPTSTNPAHTYVFERKLAALRTISRVARAG